MKIIAYKNNVKKVILDAFLMDKSIFFLLTLFLAGSLYTASVVYAIDGYSFVRMWGSQGTSDAQFTTPAGVAIDSQGNVYVLDAGNNRVQKFSNNGTFIIKWGIQGSADGQFNNPTEIGRAHV